MNRLRRSILVFGALAVSSACDDSAPGTKPPVDAAVNPIVQPDDADTIPCGPRRVLEMVCQRCHQNPPINGAPFPLVRHSDIVRNTSDGVVRERMIEQLEVGRMPMAPATIDYLSRETLLDWLHAGAPQEPPHECADPDGGTAAGE